MIIKPPKDITKYEITLSLSMEANVLKKNIALEISISLHYEKWGFCD